MSEIKLYKADIRDITDSVYHKWYSMMNKEKQNRVDRFRFTDDKKRTVAGEMLARSAIAEWCSVDEENIHFCEDEYGKPYAENLPVEFNISHSENMVICAVSDKSVGADIEKIRPISLKTAKYFCTQDELIYLFGHMPDESEFVQTADIDMLTRFFELWTKKEAYIKYLGTGLATKDIKTTSCNISYIAEKNDYIISLCTGESEQSNN